MSQISKYCIHDFKKLIPNHFNDNPQINNSELCAESHQSFDFEEEKKDYFIQTTSRHNFPKNWEFFVTYRLKSSGKSTHFLGIRRISPAYSSRVEPFVSWLYSDEQKKDAKKRRKKKMRKKDAEKRCGKKTWKKTQKRKHKSVAKIDANIRLGLG